MPTSAARLMSRGSTGYGAESDRYKYLGPRAGIGELAAVEVGGGDCGVFVEDMIASIEGGRCERVSNCGGLGCSGRPVLLGADVGAWIEALVGVLVIGNGSWKICCAKSLIDM